MQRIIATINPGETGPQIANLQDALVLLARDVIRPLDTPNRPTLEELQELTKSLVQERTQSLFGKATQQLVVYFQLQQGLGDNLRGVVEGKTAAKLNELLKSIGALDEDTSLIVRGTVKTADDQPIRGAIVLAFDRDLRKEQQFGKAETNELGEFTMSYDAAEFASGDVPSAPTPKLIVRAFVGNQQIGDDVSRPHPTRDEVVDFKALAPVVSEWEKLSAGVMPLLKGQGEGDQALPPWEVNDGDLDFIAEETKLEREKIHLWALAFAMSRDAAAATQPVAVISEIFFYGWFRQGLPLDRNRLLDRPPLDLITESRKSIEVNFVPRALSDRLEGLEATLNRLRAARALEPAPEGTPSSLGDLLGTLPSEQMLSRDQQLTVARLSHEHGHTEEFWTRAEAAGLSNAIPALKRTLALGELSVGHARVVQALQAKSDAERPESIEFLTTLEPIDWIELVFEHGAPPGSGLDRDAYIERLQSEVEAKFPTQMLGKQLQKKLGESESFPTGKVVDFLKANPDFDLRKRHVEPYLNELDNRDDSLREGLLRLGRIHALTANARETMALHDAGFGSSTQIVSEGKPAFMLKVGNQLSAERAEQVFSAAEHVMTTVVAIGTAYVAPSASGNAVYVIPAQTVSETTLKEYPSLRSLFGDLDYCECRHCRSVLGPAAYLADLLHFLQRSPLTSNPDGDLSPANRRNPDLKPLDPYLKAQAGGTVLGALLQRRPDLADLEFSCENTDTKIPYIDLVLEILENAVALPMAVAVEGVDIDAAFTGGTVPVKVAEALSKTNITVGTVLHVTPDLRPGINSLRRNWIITDGSRRWLVQHQTQQFILFIIGVGNVQVRDVAGAVASMNNGTLNAELEGRLSQGLPIHGAPQIEAIPTPSGIVQAWVARYTRAIAIKITRGSPMGTVELFRLNGRQIKVYELNGKTIQIIAQAFTSGATSTINANVATLLALPAHEIYTQTWSPTQNWWELSITNWALVGNLLEGLHVSGLTHQNSSIREHLESSPENRNPAAYEKLSTEKTVFPWALPFDLWLEETRAFLEALGIPRAHLIDLARPQSRLSEEAAALELLGVSKSEADLITSAATSTTPWTYWGLEQLNNIVMDQTAGGNRKGGWLEVLANVSMLLQQSGLSYREYLDFRETNFAGQLKGRLLPPNECKTSMIIVAGLNATQFQNHLDHVHVFTRLWRKSGWSMRELDLALMAFGGQITPTVLRDLALLKRLRGGLQLPVTVLVGCIHTLEAQAWTDHTKEGSPIAPALYDRVFQRQSLRSLTGFDDFAQEKLKNSTLRISDRADVVAASLGIKPDQVRAWIIGTPNLGIVDSANLDSLSRMYAAATLCRALSITPDVLPDIVTLLLGSATDLFRTLPAPITPDDIAQQARVRARAMLEFAERVEFVRKSGFDFETLSYLLRHRVLPGKGNDASTRIEQQLTQTLTDLRSALQAGVVLGDVSADNVKRQFARLGWYPTLIDAAMGSDGLNYQPGASVEIRPPLANEPTIPLNLRSKFSYQQLDSTKGALKCAGSLNDSDFLNIENLNLFPSGRVAALKTQYNQQLKDGGKALASLLQIVELPKIPTVTEVVTDLTALPVIPGELKDRLKFEVSSTLATEGNLTLTGWLSGADKKAVTDANPWLLAAVLSLQDKAFLKIPAPTPPQTLLDAEQLLREPDIETRYRTILLRLIPLLEVDLLVAQLSGVLGSDPQVVGTLLDVAKVPKNSGRSAKALLTDSELLRSGTKKLVDRATWPDQFAAIELLSKITAIANGLAIAPEQLEWVLGKAFAVMDVLALPTSATAAGTAAASFDGWRKLVDLFHLRDVLPDGATRLAKVYEALTQDDKPTVNGVFAKAFELDRQQHVDDACDVGLLNFNTTAPAPNDYNNPSRLLELAKLLQVGKLLGTPCSEIKKLIQPKPTESEAQLARTLFAASINASEFPERLRPISNRLRNLQRDALVAYLIHRDHLADSNELFDRYLIDVEMGSCMLTSRIKQAISSVQLFVQRCLLNLERPVPGSQEPGVTPDSIDIQRWQWMKSYRVWEANRKVFLYPENWIEPELRDDKTEIFRSFESDLLQSELTHDSALVAFRKYLDKMGDITNLTVVSMFEEQTGDGSIVHLVGRDNSEPYKHYYRQWKLRSVGDFGTWTAWEEISAQLASEHVLVFVFGGSVYLAWPTISSGQKGNLKWKIGMNLAKRSASGWTKLKKGRGEIECPMLPHTMESYTDTTGKSAFRIKHEKDERNSLAFRINYKPDTTVSIEAYGPPPQESSAVPRETKKELVSEFFSDDNEKNAGAEVSSPVITLNLRMLESYTYEYAGAVKQTHYRPATGVTFTLHSDFRTIQPKTNDLIGGFTPPVAQTSDSSGNSNEYVYNDLLGTFIKLKPVPYKNLTGDMYISTQTLVGAVKIAVKVTRGNAILAERKVTISKGNSLSWQEDFIFELKDDPHWLPSPMPTGPPNLVKAGGFTLKDDDSLELEPKPKASETYPLDIPHDTENFMSGYREVEGTHALAFSIYLSNTPSLNTTPGQYFTVPAQSVSGSIREIWSYRDDQFSLLFWRVWPDPKFRIVPFSTGGMRKLTSAVTKGRLSDAVALPKTLPPISLDVGTGVDFLRDSATKLDASNSHSVTQVKIDFEKVPTSIYNWEVFFHNPLMVATQLSQAQRFEEAQRWFHLIFDPTTNDTAAEPGRYWRFLPFRENGQGHAIDKLLQGLAKDGDVSLREQIDEWAQNPFRPHLIARQRLRSYQFAVVQKYVENLVAWGDQLFRRDTIETINEATQLYVLAAKILGKRPASSPKTASSPKSYRDIYRKLDDFSNAWIALEGPVATALFSNVASSPQYEERARGILYSLGGLYFCVPGNGKLAEYWDTVDDRLFKIRHCMNIEGVERQLPLFEPPIDPALLVRATAAGLDLATVLSNLQAPLPLYRFNVMMQKSLELCGEVRALGNALLSALEKHDAEQLSLLRSSHEMQMLKLVRAIKEQQQQEAETNLEALRKTREITAQRYVNYQRLMGKQNIVAPPEGTAATLESSTLQLAPPSAGDSDTEGLALIAAEAGHMGWLNDANNFSLIAGSLSVLAGVFHAIPDFAFGVTVPATATTAYGGSHLGSATSAVGAAVGMLATNASFQAGRSATIGGHQRRYDEWRFQSNTAAKELEQIDKQILANEIRKQIAEKEITNHNQQMANTLEVDEFMRDKFTNQQLYSWMVGQISKVYFRTYQLAHDLAKRAERTYRFELGLKDKDSSFIEFGYWDSLKKGLLSGERLYLDLKRMDSAYLDKNKREYEITKHVSFMQLNPMALLRLKETGECEVNVPEALLDMDFPGHYLRRIKSVSLTIPCVTGPYSTVPCTLTLLNHSVRHNSNASRNYTRDIENDDPRFIDSFGAIQSIVTSSAQNDSGMFETNLRDERYLPFEGAGVISTWRVELPSEYRQFNYDTISDVILLIRYTAREGGGIFKTSAIKNIDGLVKNAEAAGSVRLFSVRHEFPGEWAKFKSQIPAVNQRFELAITLRPEHYPFWSQGRLNNIVSVEIVARSTQDPVPGSMDIFDRADTADNTKNGTLTKNAAIGNLLRGQLTAGLPATPAGELRFFVETKSMADVWVAVTWGV